MSLPHTRALLHAVLDGTLDEESFATDAIFGVRVPQTCPGVPDAVLSPRRSWNDSNAYDRAAQKLADMFKLEWQKYS